MQPEAAHLKNIRSFRSNSNREHSRKYRQEDSNKWMGPNLIGNLKNKFPSDFFNHNGIPSARIRSQVKYIKSRYKTEKKLLNNFTNEFVCEQEVLPQAKITSFFNIAFDMEENKGIDFKKNNDLRSERKLKVINAGRAVQMEGSTSVELRKKLDNEVDLCCTFSKVPIRKSNFVTPTKKRNKQGWTFQNPQSSRTFSARVSRKITTQNLGREKSSIFKGRKENLRIGSEKWVGNCKNVVWTKLGKRRVNQPNQLLQNGRNCR